LNTVQQGNAEGIQMGERASPRDGKHQPRYRAATGEHNALK
jgi:hypothetical protein